MTKKIYRTAQGKSIDLGTIILQNEHVRAVGNMNVNARGDKLDNTNQVIETKPRQIQRQTARTTNVTATPVHTSTIAAKKYKREKAQEVQDTAQPIQQEISASMPEPVTAPPAPEPVKTQKIPEGGLAAAIARNREIKQELEKTRRQQLQSQGVKRI